MDISSLTLAEYARIISSYNAIRLSRSLDPRLKDRGFTDEQLKILREKMKTSVTEVRSLNIKFTRPIEEFKYSQFGYVLTLYRAYKEHGTLPFPGSISEQPAQFIEILNTIEAVELEFREKELEQQKNKDKRKSSGRR